MNENIQSLMVKAMKEREHTATNDADKLESLLSKFAELLIEECAQVVTLWSDEKPCSEGYDIHTVYKMKEHFGVNE